MRRTQHYYRYKLWNFWRNFLRRVRKNFSFSLLLFVVLSIWLLLFVYWLKGKIYAPKYHISKVIYTSWSFQQYKDPEMYSNISQMYSGTYYTALRMFREQNFSLSELQDKYPFIEDVEISQYANNTLVLDVKFIKPALRFRYKDEIYWVYNTYTLPIGSWESLWNGTPLMLLPIYLSGSSESISWVLYGIDVKKLLYDYLLIKTSSIPWTITYIPGWDKYILWNDKLRIYFNAKKDINKQLFTLSLLINNYQPFKTLEQIDLWSIDNPIVK